MKEEIGKLIQLQALDTEIIGFDQAITQHRESIARREQAIVTKQEAISQLRTKIELLNQKQQDTKIEHDTAGARVKDRQNKMMQVQTSREHQALLKEIEENKKLVKDTEDRILQCIEQVELLEQEVATLETQYAKEQQLLAEETKIAEKEIKRIEGAKTSVSSQRTNEIAALQGPQLKRYTLLLTKRDGLAVVPLANNVCQGCHMVLPPQQVIEIRKAEKFNTCPTCQRILYYQENEELSIDGE